MNRTTFAIAVAALAAPSVTAIEDVALKDLMPKGQAARNSPETALLYPAFTDQRRNHA